MKYAVRYEVDGFVEKEFFSDLRKAKSYYNKTLEQLQEHLIDIQLYKIN